MKRLASIFMMLCVLGALCVNAQVVTSSPAILQEDSQDVYITFKASEGDAGMKGSTNCYAHTGVITNKSNGEWKNAPEWGDNADKYKLAFKGTNTWRLTIGDIRTYYNITDPDERVLKLCFVFRNKDCSKTGRATDGGDIFIDVHASGLALNLTSNAPGNVLNATNSSVTFTANTSQAADIKFFLGSVDSAPVAEITANTTLTYSKNFAVGEYDVIAQATAGTEVVRDTISLCHRNDSQQLAYAGTLKQGANANADGSVTFCLYAPLKSNVMLVGEWNDYKPVNAQVMNYQGDKYFWTTVSGLDKDKEYGYYFIVDDVLNIADPYAKLVLDPWSDKWITEDMYPGLKKFPEKLGNFPVAIYHGNENVYNWEVTEFNAPDKGNLVIYEMLFRDFTDQQTISGALAKLDYIKSLGVNAIELMPIQEFDGNNSWGYNPNFYFAPDKAYGTKSDYKKFIDECHKRGIAVILDVVFNHAYGQHPWCMMYWDSTNSVPTAENPFFNTSAPHNWSVGNDWRQENPIVQQYFCDILKYWIEEYKVDGYRFDLVKGLGDSDSYANDYEGSNYNSSRIENVKVFADAIWEVNKNAYVILESYVSSSEETEYGKYGCMAWAKFVEQAQQAAGGYQSNSAFTGLVDKNNYKVSCLENHDEERNAYWVSQYGADGIKGDVVVTMRRLGANAALAFLAPGAKMMWQFEEMGYDVSIDNPGRVDPKPTHWEYLEDADRKGLVDSYSEILYIRTNNPDLFSSEAEYNMSAAYSNWDNGRFITARNTSTGKELVVAVNPTAVARTFDYTFDNPNGTYYIVSKSYDTTPSFSAANSTINVPAHGYVIISNKSELGVETIQSGVAESVKVYPNPATDVVYVNSNEVKSIEVYALTGACVASSDDSNSVDVTSLEAGTYIVKVYTSDATTVSKLVKK